MTRKIRAQLGQQVLNVVNWALCVVKCILSVSCRKIRHFNDQVFVGIISLNTGIPEN